MPKSNANERVFAFVNMLIAKMRQLGCIWIAAIAVLSFVPSATAQQTTESSQLRIPIVNEFAIGLFGLTIVVAVLYMIWPKIRPWPRKKNLPKD